MVHVNVNRSARGGLNIEVEVEVDVHSLLHCR
jgi:hypothetical protein